MADASFSQPLFGLAKLLVANQLITQEELATAHAAANQAQQPLLSYLVQKKLIKATALTEIISNLFNLPIINLKRIPLKNLPLEKLPLSLIKKWQIIPLSFQENLLDIAISDPTNLQVINEVKFLTNFSVQLFLVQEDHLQEKLQEILTRHQVSSLQDSSTQSNVSTNNMNLSIETDEPLINFVNATLQKAIDKNASDIHFEPYENFYRIRLRIDGILQEYAAPSAQLTQRLSTRLKIISKLDISENRLPQDGRCKIKLANGKTIDIRISTCPTLYGEKIVLRLLDNNQVTLTIKELSFIESQKLHFLSAIQKPQGLILVTGPTGSGKTVTLYAALRHLNTTEKNILTIEDPVEINLPGINQVNVHSKIGLTFVRALRAFLRQDPDIMMVGEIRDQETAEIAIKAAQTGHLVFATLHTNSASEALTRLNSMGIKNYDLANSVNLIIAQRLLRKLCSHCKNSKRVTSLLCQQFSLTKDSLIYEAGSCEHCTQGYQGRIAVYETLPIDEHFASMILQNNNAPLLAAESKNRGYLNLQQAALWQIQQGLTSLAEIHRVMG